MTLIMPQMSSAHKCLVSVHSELSKHIHYEPSHDVPAMIDHLRPCFRTNFRHWCSFRGCNFRFLHQRCWRSRGLWGRKRRPARLAPRSRHRGEEPEELDSVRDPEDGDHQVEPRALPQPPDHRCGQHSGWGVSQTKIKHCQFGLN